MMNQPPQQQSPTERPDCYICGKARADAHTRETRSAHSDHAMRFGWSGMCPAPQANR